MYCANCNRPRPDGECYCPECGGVLLSPAPKKRGRLWVPLAIIAVMLTVGISVFLLTLPEDSPPPSETPWFSVSGGTLYFYSDQYTGGSTLRVPSVVDGQTVTRLSSRCFMNCDQLVSVELPDTLTVIGTEAFANCGGLRGIKLPEGLQTIRKGAFADCTALEAIYVPGSVETIDETAFWGCERLIHIFFVGNSAQWSTLYTGELSPGAEIYTVSGPDADHFSPG